MYLLHSSWSIEYIDWRISQCLRHVVRRLATLHSNLQSLKVLAMQTNHQIQKRRLGWKKWLHREARKVALGFRPIEFEYYQTINSSNFWRRTRLIQARTSLGKYKTACLNAFLASSAWREPFITSVKITPFDKLLDTCHNMQFPCNYKEREFCCRLRVFRIPANTHQVTFVLTISWWDRRI